MTDDSTKDEHDINEDEVPNDDVDENNGVGDVDDLDNVNEENGVADDDDLDDNSDSDVVEPDGFSEEKVLTLTVLCPSSLSTAVHCWPKVMEGWRWVSPFFLNLSWSEFLMAVTPSP